MSEKINWEYHIGDFKRGETIPITCDEPIAEIDSSLVKYWNTLFEIAMKHAKVDYNIKVEVGIWLDTGEIITLIHDVREFCRISLSVMEIEEVYHEHLHADEKTRSKENDILSDIVKSKLLKTFNPKKFEELGNAKKGCIVVISDYDDKKTEEVIFQS